MMVRVTRRPTIVSSVAVSVLFLVMLALPAVTWAMPRYAQATGQPCSRCHVDPAGGGPRNAFGQSFEAIPTHSSDPAGAFRQLTSAPAPAAPAPAAPAAPAASPAAPAAAAPAPATGAAPAAGKAPAGLPATGDGGASSGIPAAMALLGFAAFGAGLALRRARAGSR